MALNATAAWEVAKSGSHLETHGPEFLYPDLRISLCDSLSTTSAAACPALPCTLFQSAGQKSRNPNPRPPGLVWADFSRKPAQCYLHHPEQLAKPATLLLLNLNTKSHFVVPQGKQSKHHLSSELKNLSASRLQPPAGAGPESRARRPGQGQFKFSLGQQCQTGVAPGGGEILLEGAALTQPGVVAPRQCWRAPSRWRSDHRHCSVVTPEEPAVKEHSLTTLPCLCSHLLSPSLLH